MVLFNQADVLVFLVVCVERRAFMPFCSYLDETGLVCDQW